MVLGSSTRTGSVIAPLQALPDALTHVNPHALAMAGLALATTLFGRARRDSLVPGRSCHGRGCLGVASPQRIIRPMLREIAES